MWLIIQFSSTLFISHKIETLINHNGDVTKRDLFCLKSILNYDLLTLRSVVLISYANFYFLKLLFSDSLYKNLRQWNQQTSGISHSRSLSSNVKPHHPCSHFYSFEIRWIGLKCSSEPLINSAWGNHSSGKKSSNFIRTRLFPIFRYPKWLVSLLSWSTDIDRVDHYFLALLKQHINLSHKF